jgi:hypothetical protein
MEAGSVSKVGSESARKVDPHRLVCWHLGLDKGIGEVDEAITNHGYVCSYN